VVLPRHVLPAEPQSGRCLYGSAPSTVGASGADQLNHNVHRRSITINMCNSKFKSLRCSLRSASSSFQVPHRSQHGNNKGRTRGGPPPHGVPVHVLNKSVQQNEIGSIQINCKRNHNNPKWMDSPIPKSQNPQYYAPPTGVDVVRPSNAAASRRMEARKKATAPHRTTAP
jgi:hypothetical protein